MSVVVSALTLLAPACPDPDADDGGSVHDATQHDAAVADQAVGDVLPGTDRDPLDGGALPDRISGYDAGPARDAAHGDAAGRCGDGLPDLGEECDDGNNVDADGCSAGCQRESLCGTTNSQCTDQNQVDWDGCTSCRLSEFVVSPDPCNNREDQPAVAALADGRFVAAWHSQAEPTDPATCGSYLYASVRLFGADGQPAGQELLLPTMEQAFNVDVAALADGGFALTWVTRGFWEEPPGVNAQRFSSTGAPVGDPIGVAFADDQQQHWGPQAVALGTGFAVVWERDHRGDGNAILASDVVAARFDANGSWLGETVLNQGDVVVYHEFPAAAALSDGRLAVTWLVDEWHSERLVVRLLAADGTMPGAAVEVAPILTYAYERPAIAALPDGGFVIAYEDPIDDSLAARRFGADGQPIGDRIPVAVVGSRPAAVGRSDGSFVVAWKIRSRDDGKELLRAFSSDGTPLGAVIAMNVRSSSAQSRSDLSLFADDSLVATWSAADGDNWVAVARRYNVDLTPRLR